MNQLKKNETVRLIPEFTFQLKGKSVARSTVNRWLLRAKDGYTLVGTTLLLIVFAISAFKAPKKNSIGQGSAIPIDSVQTEYNTYVAKTIWKKTEKTSKNDAAPVNGSELFAQEAAMYIENFAPVARKEQATFGVPASISLAQGLIESRAGTSKLAKSNNNHFGMKCFSRSCKRGHCSNFTDDTHKDFFRKYASPWESWRDHSRMLSKGRYAKLHKYGTDYRQWAYGLKSIGYATDATYAEKLIGVIVRYELHKYD